MRRWEVSHSEFLTTEMVANLAQAEKGANSGAWRDRRKYSVKLTRRMTM
jgi:hypothetical protein